VRSGAAAGHRGYFHETAFYGSDDEFLRIVVPFIRDGLEASEPTLVAFGPTNTALIRDVFADAPELTFLHAADQYARPGRTIASYRRMLADRVARGATQIRAVGDVPHPGLGAGWNCWARYEAAVNHALDDFPIWGLCPYDTRLTPDHVVEDVVRTHPRIATGDGEHVVNPGFEDPIAFLAGRRTPRPDPLEAGAPAVDLVDPSPSTGRNAVRAACLDTALDASEIDDLVIAVSEVVTNAWHHGRPPVRLRAWAGPERVLVAVNDRGPGPSDPFAGLLVPDRGESPGGLGLWVTHELCRDVVLGHDAGGFTVRLLAGSPVIPGSAAMPRDQLPA
jgi:anti-sigma regulatory factor (Ser/Thr protein kinase)